MVDFEHMKLPLSMFPQEIVQQYNLQDLVAVDGYIYMEIRKGMPGLKQAERLASDHLTKNLSINGYSPVNHTPSIRCHHMSTLVFLSLSTTLESSTPMKEMRTTC